MDENLEFLKAEFDTSHAYFIHIENKLANLLKYYSTLFLAVISACYYLSIANLFKDIRLISVLIAILVFDFLGLFILYMYAELRTRKIKILEQLAIIREFFSNNTGGNNKDISNFLIMVKGIKKCPKYLRRPSEDWYTILYIIFINSLGLSFGTILVIYNLIYIILNLTKKVPLFSLVSLIIISLAPFILIFTFWFYQQFKWITIFAFKSDVERENKYGLMGDYDLFLKIKQSFPWPSWLLDERATKIESDNKAKLEISIKDRSK